MNPHPGLVEFVRQRAISWLGGSWTTGRDHYMDIRQNPLWLSLWIGRWFQAEIRVSIWFPLLLVSAIVQLGATLGITVIGLLLFSTLFHEFAHLLAARRTGGGGDEIILWPLGGLTFATPAQNFYSELWTNLAGMIFHAAVCLACLPAVLATDQIESALNLLTLPQVSLHDQPAQALWLLMFSLNFKLLVINLLPIHPLDGSQLAYSIAKLYWDRPTARLGTLWAGSLIAFLLLLVGSFAGSTMLMWMAAVLTLFVVLEQVSVQVARQFDDSFLEDDESMGYSGVLHRDDEERVPQPGPLARWRQQRAAKRQQKELEQRLETERRVDELLEKVHSQGMQSLSDAERRFLTQASSRYRSRG